MAAQMDEARAIELNNILNERTNVNRQLIQSRSQYNAQVTLKKKSELTLNELSELPEEAIVYRAIGRVFIRGSLPQINTELKDIITSSESEVVKHEKNVEVLGKKLGEIDNNVKEMMKLK